MTVQALEATLPNNQHEDPCYDRAALMSLVDNDHALLREIITMFLQESPGILTDIQDAVRQTNSKKLQSSAHKLKGSASTFNSSSTVHAAQTLEDMGRTAKLANAEAALNQLEHMLRQLQQALTQLAAEFSS